MQFQQKRVRGLSPATTPTFDEFVEYLIDPATTRYEPFNGHWRPQFDLCHPCAVRYDFIGHFETIGEDSEYILRRSRRPPAGRVPGPRPRQRSEDEVGRAGPAVVSERARRARGAIETCLRQRFRFLRLSRFIIAIEFLFQPNPLYSVMNESASLFGRISGYMAERLPSGGRAGGGREGNGDERTNLSSSENHEIWQALYSLSILVYSCTIS